MKLLKLIFMSNVLFICSLASANTLARNRRTPLTAHRSPAKHRGPRVPDPHPRAAAGAAGGAISLV